MESIGMSSDIQTQINAREMTQTATQSIQHHKNQHDILDKVKQEPGYIPNPTEKALIEAIELANKKINGGNREFEFSIHEKTKQIMVKVIDTDTKELIKEIPPEKILDMVANMCEAAGIFVDEKR